MKIKSKLFIKSSAHYKQCPPSNKPEYAFIGRSNVGKSSLINSLINHKNIAKTSSKPGKTQLINHFIINNQWYIADLPGLGYAKVSKAKRREFLKMIKDYLLKRENLICVFMLIDSRQKPQNIDQEHMKWLAENKIPFVMIFTKTDKLNKKELEKNIKIYKSIMLEEWSDLPKKFLTSSETKKGIQDIQAYINDLNMTSGLVH